MKDKKEKKKKRKKEELEKPIESVTDFGENIEEVIREGKEQPLSKGAKKLKDLIGPSGFDRRYEDSIGVGSKKVRSFILNGYPELVHVGWLDKLYNSEDDLDISLHLAVADERSSLDEINMEITKQEAQYQHELKSGSIRNLGKLQTRIEQLYEQRAKLEQNNEKLFHSCIVANLHADSNEELEKKTYTTVQTLAARKIDLMSSFLRQDESYKAGLPFGVNYLEEYRTINTGGVVASFPFYNAEISHKNGIFMGLNKATATPIFVDYFDRSILNTGNTNIFGASGSGKSFLVSLMTMRSTVKNIHTVIIDPESEYVRLTKLMGGAHITLAPDSKTRINPFDIEEEWDPEVDDYVVSVKAKIGDLLNLLAAMAEGLDAEQKSVISMILKELYEEDWGINSKRESLYTNKGEFNQATGEFINAGVKKIMPTLSDFHKKLSGYVAKNPQPNLRRLVSSLTMYTKGNVYDLFDCYTSDDLKNIKDLPVVTFDVSKVEEGQLRPLAMFVALTWTWENFVKKDIDRKKRVIVDEAWMMTDPTMAGSEYTASFLNVAARRARKRNTALLIASQSFDEFVRNPHGQAVLLNASVNILLRMEAMALDSVKKVFKLSDGESQFLIGARRGEFLMKMGTDSTVGMAIPFDYEKKMIENPLKKGGNKNE